MGKKKRDDIASLVAALTAEIPALEPARLSRYLGDIAEWNDRAALVSKQTTTAALGRLVRQSAQLFDFISRYGILSRAAELPAVVDIGSGAGFPGIIWKLLEPDLSVTLVERNSKKATFLERTAVVLKLEGLEVVEADAVEAAFYDRYHSQFGVAVSVAVGAPAELAPMVVGFLNDTGCYCTVRPQRDKRPQTIGKTLSLVATEERDYGRFCLYRKSIA
jgi:16S rRNA (guanine527-N7)-methyltransferase